MKRKQVLGWVVGFFGLSAAMSAFAQDQTITFSTDKAVGETLILQVNRMSQPVLVDWGDGKTIEYQAGEEFLTTLKGQVAGSVLKITGTRSLTTFVCDDAGVTLLNVSKAPYLRSLYCKNNKLTTIDVSALRKLVDLDLANNQLETLTLKESNLPLLENINLANNKLSRIGTNTAFVFRSNTLQHVNVSGNQFTRVYTTSNPNLDALYCSDNQLKTLDLSKNTQLSTIVCSDNQLTSVGLPATGGLPVLQQFLADNNAIASLDLAASTQLADLHVTNNNMSSLGIPRKKLLSMGCGGNALAFRSLPSSANKPAASNFIYTPQADCDILSLLKYSSEYNGYYLPVCPDWNNRNEDTYVLDMSTYRLNGANRATVSFACFSIDAEGNKTRLVEASSSDRDKDYALGTGIFAFFNPFKKVVIEMSEPSYPDLVIRTMPFAVGEDMISSISTAIVRQQSEGTLYDLQGRRVTELRSGLFIHEGKKVIIK